MKTFGKDLVNASFPKTNFFYFEANDKKFIFDRDSLSIIQLPCVLNTKTIKETLRLFNDLRPKAKYALKPSLRTIALNLTNNCNFACRYCFANNGNYGKPGIAMSFSTAKMAIDLLFIEAKKNKSERTAIAFFGGEPLLAWKMIKRIVNYAKEHAPEETSLKFLITTNASLLTKEKVSFMKKNSFSVMASIDGDKKSNDLNRIDKKGNGTYDLIVKKIISANKVIPITFRATITNSNFNLVKITKHFINLGAKVITFGLDNNNLKKESYKKIMKSYQNLSEIYYQDLISGKFYEITNFSQIFFQLLFKEKKVSHCNAGLSYLGVAADGLMYKCPRFTDIKGHQFADIRNSKKVEDKIFSFHQELRKDARFRNNQCLKYPFVFLCGGLCHYDLLQKGKTIYQLIPEQCNLRKKIYQETIKLYSRLPEKTKRQFFLKITDLEDRKGGEYYE